MALTEKKKRIFAAEKENKTEAGVCTIQYRVTNLVIDWFKKVMLPNEKFIFNEPCSGCGNYDIYSISNYDGIIMAETVLNSDKKSGSFKHTNSTKGTESPHAMLIAMGKYYKDEGVSELHPEWSKDNLQIVLG